MGIRKISRVDVGEGHIVLGTRHGDGLTGSAGTMLSTASGAMTSLWVAAAVTVSMADGVLILCPTRKWRVHCHRP